MSNRLDSALSEAKQCLAAIDDPRNMPDPGIAALKLLVAYVEAQGDRE